MTRAGSWWSVSAVAVFILAGGLSLFLPVSSASAATLTHRWTFDTNADDVIGGANGTLVGNAYITNGAVVLDGTNSGVQLPNDLFTNYDSVTFEVWFFEEPYWNTSAALYQFSGTNGRMTYTVGGQGLYFLGAASQQVPIFPPVPGLTNHLVWSQDTSSQKACIYVNGVLAGQNTNFTYTPALIGPTSSDWIGAAGFQSQVFRGSVLEFRTYEGALSPLEVAMSDAAGPGQPLAAVGDLQDVRITVPNPVGPGALLIPGVFADFSNLSNVNILGQPELTLYSDNTSAVLVSTNNKLLTAELGSANITANYQGFSNTVTLAVIVPQDAPLLHRYSFNEPTNSWTAHDSVGCANGRVFGWAQGVLHWNLFTGNGELAFSTVTPCYVQLPPGIISGLSEVSAEAWITWKPLAMQLRYAWPRVFDFGNKGGDVGVTYFFLTPFASTGSSNFARATISTNWILGETPWLDWTNTLPTNIQQHVAVTYSPVRGITKFYINGAPVASGAATIKLAQITDANNWLARSQFTMDPYFNGRFNEFRIYSGLLSDADVAADYVAGPDAVGVDFVLHAYLTDAGLTITWGPSAATYALESSPALGDAAVWTPVGVTPSPQNGRLAVTLPMSDNARFFRLHAQ